MQFKVPQFIDVEDKLFGPFSFKQFIYLAGGAGLVFAIYKILPFWIGIFLIIPVVLLSLALTFYKVNNRPFILYLQAGLNYLFSNKLYIWKQRKATQKDMDKKDVSMPQKTSIVPTVGDSKLSDIAWSLDVKEKEGDLKKDMILMGQKNIIDNKKTETNKNTEGGVNN